MNQIFEFAQIYYVEVICVAVLFSLLSIILVILNFRRTSRIIRKYKRLMRGADNKNLEAMLYKQLDSIQSAITKIDDLEKNQSEFRSRLKRSTQHIGVVRYNAFDHMGSDQSFSIAMLDEYGDGFVLTSLYGRNTSCTFAKPINHRQSSYPLSDEEQEAIRKAFT
jgi:hypothetical protein